MVNRLHYIAGRIVPLTDDSASDAVRRLHKPRSRPVSSNNSSNVSPARFLATQIKGIWHHMLEDMQIYVLDKLHSELQQSNNDSPILLLCVYLVICLCAEEVQVAVTAFALHAIHFQNADADKTYAESIGSNRKLEKHIERTWTCLRGKLNGVARKTEFCEGGSLMKGGLNLLESEANFLTDLRRLVIDHGS